MRSKNVYAKNGPVVEHQLAGNDLAARHGGKVIALTLPDSLRQAIQDALVAMQEKHPEVFAAAGSIVGGFQTVDDAKYQVIRELNETSKRLVAQQ